MGTVQEGSDFHAAPAPGGAGSARRAKSCTAKSLPSGKRNRVVLPDVLARDLDVVFCGTAPGKRSAEVRAYYAHPGNRFWQTLHTTGMTSRRFVASAYRELVRHRLGLTDLAKHVSGADATLRRSDFSARALRRVIRKYQPRYVAFTSKRAAKEFFGSTVPYGLHPSSIHGTRFFVLTSPSGLATRYWQKAKYWHELAALVKNGGEASPPRARADRKLPDLAGRHRRRSVK